MKQKRPALLLILVLAILAVSMQAIAEEGFVVGSYVELDNGDSIWVSKYGEGEKSVVFFAGFGSASPTYEFIPMIKEINEALPEYTVYVYNYPGTGKTGTVESERTRANITAEIHETMEKLAVDGFTAIVHSISGAYLLSYANEYPGELEGIICIDNSVPKQALVTPYEEMFAYYDTAIAEAKAEDWDSVTPESRPEYYYLPDGYTFTEEELAQYTAYLRNSYNDSMVDELYRIEENLKGILDLTFPDDLPVLMLVSTGTQAELPTWHALHEELVTSENHEMHVVEGSHYLHYDARAEIMPMIIAFLSK